MCIRGAATGEAAFQKCIVYLRRRRAVPRTAVQTDRKGSASAREALVQILVGQLGSRPGVVVVLPGLPGTPRLGLSCPIAAIFVVVVAMYRDHCVVLIGCATGGA